MNDDTVRRQSRERPSRSETRGTALAVDEGNLYRKTKRENIPFIVYQICNLDWDVEDGVPYDRINFYFTVRRDPAFGDFTTIGHSERSRTRSAPKYEAESHCRKISAGSG